MDFERKLAWRYFRARRKSLARFTSLAAIVGITAGVASLILAQALARGFSDEMRDKILGSTAHISVFLADGTEISDWQTIKLNLEKSENVAAVSPTIFESAVIVGTKTSYAVLRVVQSPNSEVRSSSKTEDQLIEVSLGKELAEKTNLIIGDEAEIVLIEDEAAPTTRKVYVEEIYANLKNQKNFTPTNLNVAVKDIYAANETADEIRRNLGANYKAIDWQEANQPLFAALSLERKVALAIISLIIFVAALNITTTLALLVNERRLDIAVLRTCGARARSLVFIFLLEGLLLGSLGIFFGVVSGLLGCFLGNYFEAVSLSEEVYSLSYVPFRPNLENILLIIFITLLLCLAATVYPALKASKIKPLENLRQQ